LEVNDSWLRDGASVWLDLGTVRDIAEVSINAKTVATLWKPPYRADITSALKPGANQLTVKVTNEWGNRMAGDRAGPPEKRVLSGAPPAFGRAPARGPEDSGLIGPVKVLSRATQ
jgi:hypothetical protein